MRKREIRDPVHGFIHRRDAEYKIIDTPIFQRLRRIKQLAMANLVYPGATHTRFDHSIGIINDLKECLKPTSPGLAENPFNTVNDLISVWLTEELSK